MRIPLICLPPGILLIAVLTGCASSSTTPVTNPTAVSTSKNVTVSPTPAEHVVNGTGTPDDRSAISTSNQQILSSEHAQLGNSPSQTTNTPYGGIP